MDKTVYYGASNQELVVTHEVEKNKDAHLEINNTGQIHCPITGDEYKILKIKSLNYAGAQQVERVQSDGYAKYVCRRKVFQPAAK